VTIPLRGDFDTASVRAAARAPKNAGQARRLLALVTLYDGTSGTEAAKLGRVTLQIIRKLGPEALLFWSVDFTVRLPKQWSIEPTLWSTLMTTRSAVFIGGWGF
jgi:hypothetical protein